MMDHMKMLSHVIQEGSLTHSSLRGTSQGIFRRKDDGIGDNK